MAAEIVDVTDRKANPETVAMLERLLDQAKRGELRTIVIACGWADDSQTTCWVLDGRNTRRRLIGGLALAQFDLMTNTALEDDDSILYRAFNS